MRHPLCCLWISLLPWLAACSPDAPTPPSEVVADEAARPASATASDDAEKSAAEAAGSATGAIIQGELLYHSHLALQPESLAVIELLRMQQGDEAGEHSEQRVAEQRLGLVDRGVPVRFMLEVPADAAVEGARYRLRASIEQDGKVAWQADPVALAGLEPDIDLGEFILLPVRSAGFSSILQCGQLPISAGYEQDDLILQVADQRLRLLPARGETGARFEAEGDPSTRFTSRGDTALLTLRGQLYPECVAPGVLPKPFLAGGADAAWELRVEAERLSLRREGELLVEGAEYRSGTADSESLTLEVEEPELSIKVQREVCQHSSAGIPYPYRVRVSGAEQEMDGCGGDPARLLQGVDWVFETLGDHALVDGSTVSLLFYPNSRFAGRGSCNNLMGEYAAGDEGFSLSRTVTTRKACSPQLMDQERRFLELLSRVDRFVPDADGGLQLLTPQGDVIKARRD